MARMWKVFYHFDTKLGGAGIARRRKSNAPHCEWLMHLVLYIEKSEAKKRNLNACD